MLTDYHLHLRPDEDGTTADRYFTDRERRSLPRGGRGGRASPSSASPSTSTASPSRSSSGTTRSGANRPRTTSTPTASSSAAPTLRLGIEMDFVPGAEDRTANLLEARDFDYVVGSVHFIGDEAVDHEGFDIWEDAATRTGSGRVTSRRSPPPPARASSTSSPIPTWSRSGGGGGRRPSATRAPTTSRRSRRSPRPGSRSRSRPPGCASRSASSIPSPGLRRDVRRSRRRLRPLLRRPPARARRLRLRRARSSSSTGSGWGRSASSSTAARRLEAIG